MIKNTIKLILQKLFGFEKYLYIFSLFIIKKLPWDKKEKDFLYFLDMIPNEGILLDIGANIGVMSYYFSRFKPNAKIVSFEPIISNYQNLEKIIKRYNISNIQVEKCALGDEAGELEMVMPIVSSVKLHGLSHVLHKSIKDYNEGEIFTVPVKQLDSIEILNDTNQRVSAIKIDVENFEYFVLKGGKTIINRDKPIIYAELWEGDNRKSTFELLNSLGYRTKIVEKEELVDFTNQNKQNFIFIQ